MMSNYPPGVSGGVMRDDSVPHSCPNCNHVWNAPMFYELGGWFYHDDNDAFCPECGEEGKPIDTTPK